jgi:hypothetical protein
MTASTHPFYLFISNKQKTFQTFKLQLNCQMKRYVARILYIKRHMCEHQ